MSIFKRCWCSFLFLTLARGYEKHMPASDHTFWNTFLTRLDAQVPLELLECLIYGMLYTNLFGLSNGLVAIAHIKTSKDQRADFQHENNPPGSFRQFEHVWTKWRLVSHFAFLIPTWSISKLLIHKLLPTACAATAVSWRLWMGKVKVEAWIRFHVPVLLSFDLVPSKDLSIWLYWHLQRFLGLSFVWTFASICLASRTYYVFTSL